MKVLISISPQTQSVQNWIHLLPTRWISISTPMSVNYNTFLPLYGILNVLSLSSSHISRWTQENLSYFQLHNVSSHLHYLVWVCEQLPRWLLFPFLLTSGTDNAVRWIFLKSIWKTLHVCPLPSPSNINAFLITNICLFWPGLLLRLACSIKNFLAFAQTVPFIGMSSHLLAFY